MKTLPLTESDLARFWEKVDKTDTCWIWTAAVVQKYGMFSIRIDSKKRMVKAHRVSYEQQYGEIPGAAPLDHQCGVERCVRPDHLRPVSVKQNAEHRTGANTNSESGVRGVHRHGDRWRAAVRHNGVLHRSRPFETIAESEAAAIAMRNGLFTHNDADRKVA